MGIVLKAFNMVLGIIAIATFLLGTFDKTIARREYFIMGGLVLFIFTFVFYTFSKISY